MLSEEKLIKILEYYDDAILRVSQAITDGGVEGLRSRLERAVLNQMSAGEYTFRLYAIWANTVRDNIREAIRLINEGKKDDGQKLLVKAANSLSAFSEIQAHFVPFEGDILL